MKATRLLTCILLSIFLFSCDRSGIFEEFQKSIPWEFHLQVFSDDNQTQPVSDATVKIFKTQADRDNNTNVFLSGTTGADGKTIFTFKDFQPDLDAEKSKGIYYLRIEKDDLTVLDITRYLLMNDGHTHHFIVLK